MSDRTVFASAFLVASLSLFGAFTIGQLFFFHFYEALIYVAIAIMVFYGENRYSYMLGIFVPGLSLLRGLIMGGDHFPGDRRLFTPCIYSLGRTQRSVVWRCLHFRNRPVGLERPRLSS